MLTAAPNMRLRPGYGYYDVTSYPLGGSFHRAPADGLAVTECKSFPRSHGCNIWGMTADGRRIAFDSAHCEV